LEGVPYSQSAICILDFRALYILKKNLQKWCYKFATAIKILEENNQEILLLVSPPGAFYNMVSLKKGAENTFLPTHTLKFSRSMIHLHITLLDSESHHDGDVMRTFVLLIFLGTVVLIRRQKLTPRFFTDCLGRGQVNREAWRIPQAFKATIKFVSRHSCSNIRHIQIVELVHWIQTLVIILLQNVWFCGKLKSNATRT